MYLKSRKIEEKGNLAQKQPAIAVDEQKLVFFIFAASWFFDRSAAVSLIFFTAIPFALSTFFIKSLLKNESAKIRIERF